MTAVGLYLLSRLEVGSATWIAAVYMLVVGLGLGMVMQVLVLAARNAVDYRFSQQDHGGEAAPVLRTLAASLVAEMPEDA